MTLIEHPAPEELRNFGSIYGLSSERVWGHTTESWDLMLPLVVAWVRKMLDICRHDEPASLLIMGKTHGDSKWTVIYAATTPCSSRPMVEERMLQELATAMSTMVNPDLRRTVQAFGQAMLPCATMCTLYHRRTPSSRRPRLLIAHYCDEWMIFDKFSTAWRGLSASRARPVALMLQTFDWPAGHAAARVDRGVYGFQGVYNRTTYPLMNEQTVWANPVYVEGFLEEDVPAPEERP